MTGFQLKPLSQAAIPAALEKSERYRLLNEPMQAESICLDILQIDPTNDAARVGLLLALTDQFGRRANAASEARALLERLPTPYDRAYYAGVIHERLAYAALENDAPGSRYTAHEEITAAMRHFEAAEKLRPAGNDDAVLRWNTCARTLTRDTSIRPRPEDPWNESID